jgi:hypothetical protein
VRDWLAPVAAARVLFDAGLQLVHCISPKNGDALRRVLHGGEPNPRIRELLVSNGTTLELHVPRTGKPVLVLLPHEHESHILWHSMKEGTRLWVLEGLADVYAAAVALLGRPPPPTTELLAAVRAVKYVEWYRGGAYMEAVMKAKLAVFIAVFGVDVGTARWRAWYTGCKRRAGASGAPASRGYTRAPRTHLPCPLLCAARVPGRLVSVRSRACVLCARSCRSHQRRTPDQSCRFHAQPRTGGRRPRAGRCRVVPQGAPGGRSGCVEGVQRAV